MDANLTLATLNACLVAASVPFIIGGRRAIGRGDVATHRRRMLVAFGLHAVFVLSFVVRFVLYGQTPYLGSDVGEVVYKLVLYTHEPIAVVSVPLVLAALILGLRGEHFGHKLVAAWAWGAWLFSSASGILIFALVYF